MLDFLIDFISLKKYFFGTVLKDCQMKTNNVILLQQQGTTLKKTVSSNKHFTHFFLRTLKPRNSVGTIRPYDFYTTSNGRYIDVLLKPRKRSNGLIAFLGLRTQDVFNMFLFSLH